MKYSYDEAYESTLFYFNGDDLAANVWLNKYALKDKDGNFLEKTPDDMHRRIAKEFARIEANKFKKPLSEDEIFELLRNFNRIVPQGSPMYGIGNKNQYVSLSNCFPEWIEVDTENGPVLIKDVKIGDYVFTHKNRLKKVVQLHQNRLNDRKLINFKCHNHDMITCTEDHKFWSVKGCDSKADWYSISELEKGDRIRNINNEFVVIEYKSEPIYSDIDYVYTLGVEEDHSYTVRGLTALNCYVIESPLDSYASILYTDSQLVNIAKRRGGNGLDISNLRPSGTPTQNAAHTSSGIIPFVERYSNSTREVGMNNRRGALMITISVHHPQVLDFARCKQDKTKVTGANISIRLTDEFMEAVANEQKYEQRWPVDSQTPEISQMVDAKEVWQEIIKNAHDNAEPGLLFWDTIINNSPADYYANDGFSSCSTNPCSEIVLCPLDSCRLLLLNLFSYVKNPFKRNAYFDYDMFFEDAKIAQRLMDNLIDLELECIDRIIDKVNSDPEPDYIKQSELDLWIKIKEKCQQGRRTGTGITALGDTIAALGIKYGTEKSIKESEKIYRYLKFACYQSSIEMAKELGPFPVWDTNEKCEFFDRFLNEEVELNSGLIKGKNLLDQMKEYGRRNIALLTTAPAGSVSLLTQTTSGIEPLFALHYNRKKKGQPGDPDFRSDFIDDNGDHWMEFKVFHPKLKMWMDLKGKREEDSPWYGACANDIDWINRVRLQASAGLNIDHSISSTINLPNKSTPEDVAAIYEEAWKSGVKGITVYRDGCRDGVLNATTQNKIKEERPRKLPCDVHHISVKGQKYFILVGILDNEPYEVFAGKNGFLDGKIKSGIIVKKRKGYYIAKFDDSDIALEPITAATDEQEETITRLTSGLLRQGANMHFIVQQLEKVNGEMHCFAKSVARALKKYIPENTKEGSNCPICNSEDYVRQGGCPVCLTCGYSSCS